jgi:glycosyltransferase involved in cell wall biosynthesis
MTNGNITVICLIPTRNNATLLDRCLKSAGLWADIIIVCDQLSTDGSREIAMRYPKVRLIDNPTHEYSESFRQKLLINEARKIEGQRLLITLDADEIFTPNVLSSPEWQTILDSKPGTIFKFQWANFAPGLRNMWLGYHFPW